MTDRLGQVTRNAVAAFSGNRIVTETASKVSAQPPPGLSYCRALAEAGIGGERAGLESYEDLDAAKRVEALQPLVAAIKKQQLLFIDELRQPITWVPEDDEVPGQRRIIVGGIQDSKDVAFLRSVLEEARNKVVKEEDKPTEMVLVSIHPDDWVSQGKWALHGRYEWQEKRLVGPSRLPREDSPVVDQLLVELLDRESSPLLHYFPDICRFADQHRQRSPTALVLFHCKMGQSRSVAAVTGYEMWRHYQAVRGSIEWHGKSDERKIDELKAVKEEYGKFLTAARQGANLDKFETQLDLWAEWLVGGVDTSGPPAITQTRESPKRESAMKDAAVLVFYQHNELPPLNLVEYYQERVRLGAPAGSMLNSGKNWETTVVEGREPLSAFMGRCKVAHNMTNALCRRVKPEK